jgi:surface carbohydrate biosynthesis protein (TIGR04326 family)
MKILNIYEYPSISLNKKSYNIVWNEKLLSESKYSFSIFNLINQDSIKLKLDANNLYKNFFLKNKKYFYPSFNLKKDFSFLVLSNFVEKNHYKVNYNLYLLKCLALKNFLKSNQFNQINIFSKNKKFFSLINNLIKLDDKYEKKSDLVYNFLKLTNLFIKNSIQFIIFFLKNVNFDNKPNKIINRKPIFFSFFSYTDKQKAISGLYHSEYWKAFSNTENKNWVHLHDFSLNYKNSRMTRKVIQKLNLNKQEENHFFLDDYINQKTFIKTIFFITRLFFCLSKLILSKKFNLILKKKLYLNSENYLNFYKEFISFNSFRNILFFFQFEEFFLKNKIQSNIFFTLENQPWEKILLYFAKKNKFNTKTYGIIHSSVRFWDLRFINFMNDNKLFFGYRNPYKVLYNSFFVKKILKQNGFKKNILQSSETLRYLNLKKSSVKKKKIKNKNKKLNLLFVTDYDDHQNKLLLEIIKDLKLKNQYCLYLKNHPLKKLKIKQNNLKIVKDINDLASKIDFAIVGNKTAASIDLYYKNFNILIFLESNNLDYSPLYKFIDYKTFSSFDELKNILDNNFVRSKHFSIKNSKKRYFITNKNLIKWKQILKS